jgi:tetratricopeptide (TPR) repeat protein
MLPLSVIIGCALAIRVLHLVLERDNPFFGPSLLDARYYHDWALRIVGGDVASRGVFYGLPLYPYVLALSYAAFGPSVVAVEIVQLVLGLATIGLVYALGTRLADATVGLVAAFVATAYGPLLFYETMFIPEVLAVPLYAAALWSCCTLLDAPAVRRGATAGLLLGLAALAKAGVIVFSVGFAIALLIRPSLAARGRVRQAVAALSCTFAVVLGVVTLHNRVWGDDWVFLTSHAGLNFFIGNNADADGTFRAPPGTGLGLQAQIADSRAIAEAAAGHALKPSEVSAYWSERGRAFIRGDPDRFLRLAVRKLGLVFDARELPDLQDYAMAGRFNPLLRLPWPSFGLVGPLALAGLVMSTGLRHRWCVWLWIGSYLTGLLSFFVNGRYRLPLLPIAFVLAAIGLVASVRLVRAHAWTRLGAYAIVAIAAAGLTRLELVAVDPARDDVNAASLRLEARDDTGALALYERALDVNPDNAQASLGMGIVLERLGRADEAGSFYARSIAAAPDPAAYNNLGVWYQRRGKLDEAEAAYREAIALKPHFAQAHDNLGIIYALGGDDAQAIAAFETALRLDPNSCQAETNLGHALQRARRTDDARRHWAHAIATDPGCGAAAKALAAVDGGS